MTSHPHSQPDIDDLLSDLTDTLKPQGALRPLCLRAAEVIAELRHPRSGVQSADVAEAIRAHFMVMG